MLRRSSLVSLLALILLPACSLSPHSTIDVGNEIKTWRVQYRAQHPDDPFLDAVDAQTLRQGMDRLHVLLAWGAPRYREIKPDGREEKWVYDLTEEPLAQPRRLAHLLFERRRDALVLVSWRVNRGFIYFVDSAEQGRFPTDIKGIPPVDALKGHTP